MTTKKLPIAPFCRVGTKNPIRKFGDEMYVGCRFLRYKTAAKGFVKELKNEGYTARITNPEYTTPQLVPIYIVWMKKTDYNKKNKTLHSQFKRMVK